MMHSLRPSSLFRPSSRPTSPAPAPPSAPPRLEMIGPADRARPLTKLSLTNFRRPSPVLAPSPAPAIAITQDGSYLDVLGLRLSEAVSKALAQPTGPAAVNEQLNGKRPVPSGRGQALGALIATELKASHDNPHLRKAILRCLQRPLSTLLTNLSANLLPLLSSAAFTSPPAPTPQNPSLNPTQSHALALANFAGELLETFDELGLSLENDPRGDGLKATRDSLASIVNRVVKPLAAGIRDDLVGLISGLEITPANYNGLTGAPSKTTATAKVGSAQYPSITALQTVMPVYARTFTRLFVTSASQSHLATILISLVWHGLVTLAYRVPSPITPPTSPASAPKKVRSTTPPTTPPSSRFILKLPPSRPPSPPGLRCVPPTLADAKMLHELLRTLPRPSEKEATRLAREAVDDAFDGLRALVALLESVQANNSAKTPDELSKELGIVSADMPALVALPVLLHTYVFPVLSSDSPRSVAAVIGLSEEQYRQGCLTGFGRADECTVAVGQRVLDFLRREPATSINPYAAAVVQWLEVEVTSAAVSP
ncbi:hypothetical protein EWM64_g10024 [Hericium alpestre]|uniref:Uncharacterized protein n=1 Tax=Hericium alpestre TaxID=135208 RepID=A0A4Y9ZK14_9AGAM|nr:hypothetical protein EWM64_g10024 [Hericium alpestre]